MTDEEKKAEFRDKLRSISFGVVPGGYQDENSGSMYDREAIATQLGGADGEPVFSEERVNDKRSDFRKHYREFQSYS